MTDQERQTNIQIPIANERIILQLFGPQDTHRRFLERQFKVKCYAKNKNLILHGYQQRLILAQYAIKQLVKIIEQGQPLFLREVERVVSFCLSEDPDIVARESVDLDPDELRVHKKTQGIRFETYDHRSIQAKTKNQQHYIEQILDHDITLGIGPAGTGKTYLAVACAVRALKQHEVKRIVLTRPAVEAGEKLGFLPGSLVEKVNPYLRPLYDALFEMLGPEQAQKAIDEQIIEIAPLAFMRGRTLNQSFVILDEAQNTTREQMRMFLTRIGYSSKAVITGDMTQTDLGKKHDSGLAQASRILKGIKGIAQVNLTTADVVRHPLVRAIIKAYESEDQRMEQARADRKREREEKEKARTESADTEKTDT